MTRFNAFVFKVNARKHFESVQSSQLKRNISHRSRDANHVILNFATKRIHFSHVHKKLSSTDLRGHQEVQVFCFAELFLSPINLIFVTGFCQYSFQSWYIKAAVTENSQDFAAYVPNLLLNSYNFNSRIATNAVFLQICSPGP